MSLARTRWLFPSMHDSGKKHIADKTAYNVLAFYLDKAGLPSRPFHSLRATCIKLCQRKGWTIEQVMKQGASTRNRLGRISQVEGKGHIKIRCSAGNGHPLSNANVASKRGRGLRWSLSSSTVWTRGPFLLISPFLLNHFTYCFKCVDTDFYSGCWMG